MGPTHFYGARAEKTPQKADFAMKQTNICRLSGDIKKITFFITSTNVFLASKNAFLTFLKFIPDVYNIYT